MAVAVVVVVVAAAAAAAAGGVVAVVVVVVVVVLVPRVELILPVRIVSNTTLLRNLGSPRPIGEAHAPKARDSALPFMGEVAKCLEDIAIVFPAVSAVAT